MDDPTTGPTTDVLRQRFEGHLVNLQRMLQLCQQQETQIDKGQTDALMRTLSAKNPIVQTLATEAESLRQTLASAAGSLDDSVRRELQRLKGECESIGATILETEQRCESKLVSHRQQISEQIQSMQSGSDATDRYQQVSDGTGGDRCGSVLDLQSE